MAIVRFANNQGPVIGTFSNMPGYSNNGNFTAVIDGTGESLTMIGRIQLEGGPGSKTISSAGGKIYFITSSITFANAGTTLRVGLQDVGATGFEDGTFDVYDDLVGATDTISNGVVNTVTMSSGTKTLTHGDLVALSFELISRGGSDSMRLLRYSTTQTLFPYYSEDTGAGSVKTGNTFSTPHAIEFDDGTIGWLGPLTCANISTTTTSFSLSTTPDEYALVFRLPFKAEISSVIFHMSNIATADNFEVILYSDPFGTPVAEQTIAYNAFEIAGSSIGIFDIPITPTEVEKDTYYALAIRPTTTNSISLQIGSFGSGNSKLRRTTVLGENWTTGTRVDQTGAFTSVPESVIMAGFRISGVDSGGSGGSFLYA